MSRLRILLSVVAFLAFRSFADTNAHHIKITGIVSLPEFKRVLVEDDPPLPDHLSLPPIMEEDDRDGGVKLLRIHPESESAEFDDSDGKRTVALQSGANGMERPKHFIHLRNANLRQVIRLYAQLKNCTILEHPSLAHGTMFSLDVAVGSAAEAVVAMQRLMKQEGMEAVPDGKKFVMLVPKNLTKKVTPRADRLLAQKSAPGVKEETIPAGYVDFRRTPLAQVLLVYSELIGRKITNFSAAPWREISLLTMTPLTKAEVTYAVETLLGWNGVTFVERAPGVVEAVFGLVP